jgi:hypothetical protein
MKYNASRTDPCGLLGAHIPLHPVANGVTLRRLDRAQALNMLPPPFLTRRLNWGDPAIQSLLVNLGPQRPSQHAPAKQVLPWQLRHQQVAVGTGADRPLGRGLLLAA